MQEFDMSLIELIFLSAMHCQHTDRAIIKNQRDGAKRSAFLSGHEAAAQNLVGKVIANQKRLSGIYKVFHQVVSNRPRTLGKTHTVHDFNFESDFLGLVILKGDEKTGDVKQTAHFRINALEQGVQIERRTERATDFVQDVKFLGAPRCLLDEQAIFHSHSDLMAERQKKPQFRRGEVAAVGSGEKQYAKSVFFRLQTD